MDIIFLKELRIDTVVGIYPWEAKIKQTVIVDIEAGVDIRAAAASCDIADTLNYAALAEELTNFIGSQHFKLLETMAQQAADYVHQQFKVNWLRLKINKAGAVLNATEVGVIIERRFTD